MLTTVHKKIVFYLFFLLHAPLIHAQECDKIIDKIKSALDKSLLDEAMLQVTALRSCDVSLSGKDEADRWTERIFEKIKALEKGFKLNEDKAKAQKKNAQNYEKLAKEALSNLEKERDTSFKYSRLALEEVKKTERAVAEKNNAIELNQLLIEANEQHLLGLKFLYEKRYDESIKIFQSTIENVNSKTVEKTEGLTDKLTLIQEDLNIAIRHKEKREEFFSLIFLADSMISKGVVDFTRVFHIYKKAKYMQVDSALVLSKLKTLESTLSKKVLVEQEWPLYDSTLLARAHLYSYLSDINQMKYYLNRFTKLEPKYAPQSTNVLVTSYLANRIIKSFPGFELGFGVKTFYHDPFFGQNAIKVQYRGKTSLFPHSPWYLPYFFNFFYHFDNKNSIGLQFTGSNNKYRTSSLTLENGITFVEFTKPQIGSIVSVLYNYNLLSFYSKKRQSKLFSVKLVGGLSYDNLILPFGEFNLQFIDVPAGPEEVTHFPESISLSKTYRFLSNNFFYANSFSWQSLRFSSSAPSDNFSENRTRIKENGTDFINFVIGSKIDFRPFQRLPVYSFLVFDYNFTFGNKSNPITVNPAEEIYQDFLFHHRDRMTESFRQEIYNYYQSCDCKITYESNPKRYTTGFSIALGLSYRF